MSSEHDEEKNPLTNTTTTTTTTNSTSNTITSPLEMAGPKEQESFSDRLMLPLVERYSVKLLMRVWGPRLAFIVRLMLLATFLDDSISTASKFAEHIEQVAEQGCLRWLVESSPIFTTGLATLLLSAGLLAQCLGSLSLLVLYHPDIGTKALIGWVIAQPVLYAQVTNVDLLCESLTLLGGLLMLRAHLVYGNERFSDGARIQFFARLLLPAVYLYDAGEFLLSAFTLDETSSFSMFFSDLSIFVADTVAIIALVIGCTLVAAGLKSRLVALLLALFNLGYVFYQHPFFRYIWLENGEWKYNEEKLLMSTAHVALPAQVSMNDFDTSQLYDLQRYYFFLGLSTSGALMLLAQYGPGEIAVQKDEVILPVFERAQAKELD